MWHVILRLHTFSRCGVSKEEGNGVVTEKGKENVGAVKLDPMFRKGSIFYISNFRGVYLIIIFECKLYCNMVYIGQYNLIFDKFCLPIFFCYFIFYNSTTWLVAPKKYISIIINWSIQRCILNTKIIKYLSNKFVCLKGKVADL